MFIIKIFKIKMEKQIVSPFFISNFIFQIIKRELILDQIQVNIYLRHYKFLLSLDCILVI